MITSLLRVNNITFYMGIGIEPNPHWTKLNNISILFNFFIIKFFIFTIYIKCKLNKWKVKKKVIYENFQKQYYILLLMNVDNKRKNRKWICEIIIGLEQGIWFPF